jgi:hypothetical protein
LQICATFTAAFIGIVVALYWNGYLGVIPEAAEYVYSNICPQYVGDTLLQRDWDDYGM